MPSASSHPWFALKVSLLAAVMLVAFPVKDAYSQDNCRLVEQRTQDLADRLDILRLDYPLTYAWVCNSIEEAVGSNNPFGEDLGFLMAMYVVCAVMFGGENCNYVIGEFIGIGTQYGNLSDLATQRGCPKPQLRNPC